MYVSKEILISQTSEKLIAAEPRSNIVASRGRSSSEVINDEHRVAEIIGALVSYGCKGSIRHTAIGLQATACDSHVGAIRWEILGGQIISEPFAVDVVGHNSVFRFAVKKLFQEGSYLVTDLPNVIHVLRHRWQRRVQVSGDLRVSFVHPTTTELVHGRVRDVSYHGIAFWLDTEGQLVSGLELEEVVVTLPELETRLKCQVCFVQKGFDRRWLCGLRVHTCLDGNLKWYQLVEDYLHPGTNVGSRWCEETWSLYEKCGYLSLSGKNPKNFGQLRRAFQSVSKQLDHAPQIGCQVVWPTRTGKHVTAALSMLKVYHGTWLGFQGAKMTGPSPEGIPGRTVLFRIHQRAYEHVQRDPDLKWVLAYLQLRKMWTRMAHVDLPARYVESGDVCIIRFRAFEVPCTNRAASSQNTHELDVDVASSNELDQLVELISSHRPEAYVDALDLTRDRLDLGSNKRLWRGVRLERDRVILVARRFGAAVAAAILELGAEGTHIYGLIDLVRLYPLVPGGKVAFSDLICAAKTWYAGHGRKGFACFVENDMPVLESTRKAMVDLGEADLVLMSADRMPDWLEQVHLVTAPRPVVG